jgi:hypothetical protein
MHWFWIILGIILIGVGLIDLFLSALDYDESGVLTLRLQALQWRVLRGVSLQLPEPWRGFARGQVVGLQILLNLVVWVGLVIVGFGFVYYGLMYGHNFAFSGSDIGPSLQYAIYFSAGQLSTVGSGGVIPENTLLRALSLVETLIGLGLVALAISFLISVFETITYLRTLSSDLYYASPGACDPVSNLSIYFPKGQPTGLSNYLGRLYQNLGSYYSGLRLHHTAYYYQGRETHMSIVYTVHVLGEVIGALRWGLPEESSVSAEPLITLLANQFTSFLYYLDSQFRWQIEDPVPAQPYEAFAQVYQGGREAGDMWLNRFLSMDRGMHQLVRAEQKPDVDHAYGRYAEWLPFASRTQTAVDWMAQHLAHDLGR